MKFGIALFVLLSTGLAQASDGLDGVYQGCFGPGYSWKNAGVTISPAGKYYKPGYDQLGLPVKGLWAVTRGLDRGVSEVRNFFGTRYRTSNAEGQFEILKNLIQRRANELPDDEFKEFRVGCMVLCATANYLEYDERVQTKFGSIVTLVDQKRGECTEFAEFADHLAGLMGISSHTVLNTGGRHAYVQFYMNGAHKWYYAEPQSPYCRYFDPDNR